MVAIRFVIVFLLVCQWGDLMVQLSATEFDIVMSSRHENMATTHNKLFTSFFILNTLKCFLLGVDSMLGLQPD